MALAASQYSGIDLAYEWRSLLDSVRGHLEAEQTVQMVLLALITNAITNQLLIRCQKSQP